MIPLLACRRAATGAAAASGAVAVTLITGLTPFVSPVRAAPPPPYPKAVEDTAVAARAVLARAGRESCLRGKLTRALLGLSGSCEVAGSRNALCTLADRAVVVTPMSVSFMEETSRELLKLIQPAQPLVTSVRDAASGLDATSEP